MIAVSSMDVEQDDDRGIRCPRCHCRHRPADPTQVKKTIALGPSSAIQRVRVCRHCKKRFVTYERVAGVPPANGKITQ